MGVDKPNYTQIPNLLLDDVMMYMDGNELKVTLAIARQTFGYHREKIKLTITDIEALTGLSRPSVTTAIDVGIRRRMICRDVGDDGKHIYSIVINDDVIAGGKEILPVKKVYHDDSKEILPPAVKKVDRGSKEILPKPVKKVDTATPTLKKEKETIKEKEEEEDTHARDDVRQTWLDCYEEELPANLDIPMTGLIAETSEAAVIYGIKASVEAKARNFRYIAQCARNYIPAANNGYRKSYSLRLDTDQVDLPPAKPMPEIAPRAPSSTSGQAAPPQEAPSSLAALWTVALAELIPTLPGVAASYLTGSRLQEGDSVDDVPLITLVLEARAAAGISWLSVQAGPAIRRKLSSLLGHPVLVEMSCEGDM